jgi:hypothetical protein
MSDLSTAIHLLATESFIAVNPSTVTISRTTTTPDGRGGRSAGATATTAVTGRLVGQKTGSGDQERTGPDGHQVGANHTYVMPAGTDAKQGDTFDIGSQTYLIVFVSDSPPWRVNAEVIDA